MDTHDWHVTIAAQERLSLCPSEAARTSAASALARAGGPHLALFCVADDHLHLVVHGSRERAGRVAGNVALALRVVCEPALAPARVRAVNGRSHLASLVPYVLDQSTHHELVTATHPARWPGSSFADLVGARRLEGFDRGVFRELLPRWSEAQLCEAVGLPPFGAVGDDRLAELDVERWRDGMASALGVPSLTGRTPRVVAGRKVLLGLARRLGRSRDLAEILRLPSRTGRWLAAAEPDLELERVFRRQVGLCDAVDGYGQG